MSAMIPAVVEKHLDAVQLCDDGKVLLGCSNLTGRYWNGSLWCFQRVEDAPDIEKCVTGVETQSGICDIACLGENRVVLGLDSGTLELYQLESDPTLFRSLFYSTEHDDSLCSLSVNSNQCRVVSCSYDKCIKVWDVETWTSVTTYRPAHGNIVWQVSCSPVEPHVFLSCSQDGKVMLWDLRLPKPATVLNKTPLYSIPTAITWQPQGSTVFASGDDSGKVVVKDIRGERSAVKDYQVHHRSIYRLAFSPTDPTLLASCADDTNLFVTNIGKKTPVIVYHSDDHMDYIRGLVWSSDNALISCGFDKQVLKHLVSSCEMEIASPNNSLPTL